MMKIIRFCFCAVIMLLFGGRMQAQCNADFNYNINVNNLNCYPKDSIAGAVDSWYIESDTSSVYYSYVGYDFNHNVSVPGTYNVTHIIYDSLNACSDTATKSISINFTPTCTADFYFNTGNVLAGNQYTFYAQPQTMGASIDSSLWMIDSIEVDKEFQFDYTFLKPGLHNVCLKIITASGCEANNCRSVIAFSKCNDSLSFTYHVDSLLPHAVAFTISSPLLPHATYYWDTQSQYEYGTADSGTKIIQFQAPGNYYVKLWQLDSANACFDTISQNISVAATHCDTIPEISFFTSPLDSSHLQTIQFFCSDSADVQNWTFSGFSNTQPFNVSVQANNPVYTFPFTGNYLACVNTHAIEGCAQKTCGWFYVNANNIDTSLCNSTTLTFNYIKNVNNPKQVSFNAISNKNISIESWYIYNINNRFDSVAINAFNPVYNFPDTGIYNVCVIASYDSSCNKEYCNTIYIHDTTVNAGGTTINNFISSYPNPANDKVTMNLKLNTPATIHINIYNLNGQNVYSSQVGCIKGNNAITIPVQNLPQGQYFIDINNNGLRKRSIFQKF